jgi:hypothetical protein
MTTAIAAKNILFAKMIQRSFMNKLNRTFKVNAGIYGPGESRKVRCRKREESVETDDVGWRNPAVILFFREPWGKMTNRLFEDDNKQTGVLEWLLLLHDHACVADGKVRSLERRVGWL